jgi:hypothetical protein
MAPQPEQSQDSGLLRTAIRVLSALVEWRKPDAGDVECLRVSVGPVDADLPTDDLARLVVEQEIARRKPGN